MTGLMAQTTVMDPFIKPGFAALTRSFITVLLFGLLILLIIMVGYHFVVDMRARRRERLRRKIMDAVGRVATAAAAGKNVKAAISDPESLFNRRGIAVLTRVFDAMNDEGRAALRQILLQIGGAKYIKNQLNTQNEDYLVELIRMVGDLDLVGLDQVVQVLLYRHRDNIEIQYQGFLALSKLGSGELLLKICKDESFVQTLSFRSLQQIFAAYTGDAATLFSELIDSPDHYVVRICIKRIGSDGLVQLADSVIPMLESGDYNLVIDAVRTLGRLKYATAAPRMVPLLKHERWEVRAVAATALAGIDTDGYTRELVRALQDSEWQVRYNAGLALRASSNMDTVRQMVLDSGDRYALDMLEYMTQCEEMWRQAQ